MKPFVLFLSKDASSGQRYCFVFLVQSVIDKTKSCIIVLYFKTMLLISESKMSALETDVIVVEDGPGILDDDDDDKQDNDSGIQNDEKEEEEEDKVINKREKNKEKNKKPSFKIKSPKKISNGSRSKSLSKNSLSSPEKSPKKRRKKFPPKPEKKDHDGTIMPNPQFDAERTAQR